MKHKVLDLFAGIGGFSLGLEATGGFETTAFCELDKKAQLVLKKHWPDTPIYEDIKELTYERLRADGNVPTVITGGFPCQDISCAGKAKGILAERSGLWSEMFRLIRDVRPTWAIIENVSALRSKGLTLVLQNLCEIGYMCEWHCIPASAVGAPHQRDRIWIIAYPKSKRTRKDNGRIRSGTSGVSGRQEADTAQVAHPNDSGDRSSQRRDMPKIREAILQGWQEHTLSEPSGYCEDVANSMQQHETQRGECEITESQGDGGGTEQGRSEGDAERQRSIRCSGGDTCDEVADSDSQRCGGGDGTGCADAERLILQGEQEGSTVGSEAEGCGSSHREPVEMGNPDSKQVDSVLNGSGEVASPWELHSSYASFGFGGDFWKVEPNVGRVAHGVPKRVDRLKQLGNSVVPQIPYLLGCAILSTETLDAEEDNNAHDSN
jgi:DNA-cytosine methyltransferase